MAEQKFDLNRFQEWAKGMRKMEGQFHFFQLLGEFPAMIEVVSREVNFVKSLQDKRVNLEGEIVRIEASVVEANEKAEREKKGIETALEKIKGDYRRRLQQESETTKKALDEFQETRKSLKKEIEAKQLELRSVETRLEEEAAKVRSVQRTAETLKTELRSLRG